MGAVERATDDRNDALATAHCLLNLPGTDVGRRRGRREHEHHGLGLADEVAETPAPFLAAGDGVAVQGRLVTQEPQRDIELIGEIEILAAVGDEDAQSAAFVGRRLAGRRPGVLPVHDRSSAGAQSAALAVS